jgi:hypothetical protein
MIKLERITFIDHIFKEQFSFKLILAACKTLFCCRFSDNHQKEMKKIEQKEKNE